MSDPLALRALYSAKGSVSVKTTVAEFIAAAYAALGQTIVIPNITAMMFQIQLDAAATKSLLLGDEHITTVIYGQQILPLGTDNLGPTRMNQIPLANLYMMSEDGVTAVTVHIIAIPG